MHNFKNNFFRRLPETACKCGNEKKLKRANLENRVNVQKQSPKMLSKKSFFLIFYLFVSFWYYSISILSKSSRTEVFVKKMFLKILQNSKENTFTGVSFFKRC